MFNDFIQNAYRDQEEGDLSDRLMETLIYFLTNCVVIYVYPLTCNN